VNAAPERVFEIASDFEGAAGTVAAITKTELLTDGPVRVGTRFRETRTMFNREATEEMEVTAFDPPRSYALACENHGTRFHSVVRVVPGAGGCNLEMECEATPLTLPAKVMCFLMKPFMKKMMRGIATDLDDVARAAEQRPGTDATA
jgi:hypothetical protein